MNGNGYSTGPPGASRQMGGPTGQPGMARQPSSLSQPSQTSLSAGMNQGVSAMKVKLCFNGDLIAIRVATDIQYQQLYEKVRERLKIPAAEQIQLFYKDEATGDKPSLMSNNDLDFALQRNEKLLIFVEQV
jgi:bud emergence protein 1